MKSLRALKAAGLILAAVVLGLMTVQGSYALWNAAVSAPAATVQAADFKVNVDGIPLSQGQQFALPAAKLSLEKSVAITQVRVGAALNVTPDSPFVSTTTVTVNPVPAGSPLVVTVAHATDGVCTDLQVFKNSVIIPAQKANVEQTLCFRTALKDGTTNQMLGGPGIATSVTVGVAQVPHK